MKKPILFLIGVLIMGAALAVDPSSYYALTAPKHAILIVLAPLITVLILIQAKHIRIGVLPVLIGIRIAWLGLSNPDWVSHPGNDSFYLHLSLLLIVIMVQQLKKEEIAKLLFQTVFWVGLIQVVIGIWQVINFTPDPSTPMKTAFIGTLGTPNGLGILIVLTILAGVQLFYTARFLPKKFLYGIGVAFLLIGLVLSESRGAWIALLVSGSFVVLLFNVQALKRMVGTGFKAFYLIGALVLLLGIVVITLYQVDTESSSGRWMIWDITTEMIKDKPITGIGQGQYSVEYLNYQAEYLSKPYNKELHAKAANIKQAHNEFLQAFTEGGIVGGLLFGSIWILPLLISIKKIFHQQDKTELDQVIVSGIVLAIVIHSLVDSPLHVLPVSVIGYVSLSMMDPVSKTFDLSRVSKWVFMVFGMCYLLFVSVRTLRIYPAQNSWRRGVELAEQREWKASIYQYEKAMEKFRQKGALAYHLGSALIFDEQYSKGIYYLNQAKKDFNDKNIYLTESYANIQLKKFKEGERLAKKALAMFPSHLAPHLLLGEIYYEQGRIEESKASLLKCINEEISKKSWETKQISVDAEKYWNNVFGQIPDSY